jgi:hypothetical protein
MCGVPDTLVASVASPSPPEERKLRDEWPIRAAGGFDRDRMRRHSSAFKSTPVTKPRNYPY